MDNQKWYYKQQNWSEGRYVGETLARPSICDPKLSPTDQFKQASKHLHDDAIDSRKSVLDNGAHKAGEVTAGVTGLAVAGSIFYVAGPVGIIFPIATGMAAVTSGLMAGAAVKELTRGIGRVFLEAATPPPPADHVDHYLRDCKASREAQPPMPVASAAMQYANPGLNKPH